jgi:hypothetical protein
VREMRIGENYERNITPFRSDFREAQSLKTQKMSGAFKTAVESLG